MGWLSVTTLLTAVFILYISHAMYNMYQLFTPALCETNSKNCLLPYFESDAFGIFTPVQLRVYVSTKSNDIGKLVSTTSNFQLSESRKIQVNVTLPRTTLKNGTLYAHCFLLPNEYLKDSPTSAPWKVHQSSILTFYQIPVAEKFSLVGGDNSSDVSESHSKKQKDQPVTHLRSVLPLTSSYEAPYFAKDQLPSELRQFIGLHGNSQRYLPIFYLNRLGFRNKDLVEVVESKPEATLTINYDPISIGKLRLLVTTYYSLEQMKDLGFTEKDLDEVKGVFVDTNLYLLAVTVFVSSIHILFDTLSFKNDIHFWRNRKTMVGLSTKALLWRCFSGTIIFFYLLDQDTSLLVLIPSGISTLIEYWKVTKAFKISFSFSSGVKFGSQSDAEAETDAFDGQAMKWLSVLLIPLCIGGAIYSLAYVPHKSWRSWGLQSAANGVYAFGFLFMLPQLFVNYKLKSVAHLPWRAFMYKAFNTFIDDLFAFIITMPTAHRLACFRDDIVFLVYLYQRYLYPVDHTRVNEFGESGEDADVAKEEDAKKND